MRRPPRVAIKSLDRLLVMASAAFLLLGVAIVTANVASRYLLHLPLSWAAESARYAIVWSALLAAAVLVNRHQHLTVMLPGARSDSRANRVTDLFVAIGSMCFFLILAVSGVLLVRNTFGQVASSMEYLPMPVVYSIVPISALLMWLGTVANLVRILGSGPSPQDDDP